MKVDTEPILQMLRMAATLGDEVTVATDRDGWTVCPMDAAHVAMAQVSVAMEGWDTRTFAIDCGKAIDALKGLKVADISLDGGWFTVKAEGFRRGMRLIEPTEPRMPPVPETDASCVVDSDRLRQVIGAFNLKRFTDMQKVTLTLSPSGLTAEVGDEMDEAAVTIAADEMAVPPEGEARAMYPLDYWQAFLSAVPKGRMLEISMGTDYPVSVDFSGDGVKGRWLCAPRLESD